MYVYIHDTVFDYTGHHAVAHVTVELDSDLLFATVDQLTYLLILTGVVSEV